MGFKFNPFTGNFDLSASVPPDTVVAPGGPSVDNSVVRFDGISGTVIQDSQVIIDDSGNILPETDSTQSLGGVGAAWGSVVTNNIFSPFNFDITLTDGRLYNPSGTVIIDGTGSNLQDNTGEVSVEWDGRLLDDSDGTPSVNWENRSLLDASSTMQFAWDGNGVNLPTVTASHALITDNNQYVTASPTTSTELGYVSGVTSSIQDQLDDITSGTTPIALTDSHIFVGNASNQAADVAVSGDVTITNTGIVQIAAGVIVNADINASAGISASKIADGSVNNTEFQYLDGLTANIQDQLDDKQDLSEKGQPNGYASLDGGGKVPVAQLPNSIMEFQGVWDASTNTPTLADGSGNTGDVYRVNVAGTQDLGSGPITFVVSDWVMYDGTIWQLAHAGADVVLLVNGQSGIVVLDTDDIAEGSNLYFTDERAQDAVGGILANSSKVSLTYSDGTPSITADIVAGSLVNADINATAAIDATKIANGSVSNAEFQFLDGVTSSIQTQLNGKQATGNYITSLTGDVTGTGPGATATTLATVNSSPGSFGSASDTLSVTVNGKGLATSVTSQAIQIAESQVTNLVSDLAGKQPTGNYITALTGDATATGPGSVALTLATVNASPGSIGSASQSLSLTVNGKGLVTSSTAQSIQIAESQVTNLVSDLAGKQATGNYITALTGDVTAAGPGSSAATIANLAVTNAKIANATIDLTTKVTGTLPVANGGTGQSTYTDGQLLIGNTSGNTLTKSTLTAGSGVSITNGNGSISISATGSGGTVTSVSVATANGLAGSVANATTTPAITLSTTVTGLLKGNGTAISAAVSGTDYQAAGNYAVASTGDLNETSFTAADNQAAAANVTGFAFANGTVRSVDAIVSIVRNNTYAQYKLNAIQKAASWELSQSRVGDDTGLVFTITTAGQIQYTSTSTGFTAAVKFRAITTSV